MTTERTDQAEPSDGTVPPESEKWNFNVLLSQGTCVDTASFLASPRLVIPFLYFAIGAPVFFAGLLLPLVQFARLVTQIVAAPILTAVRTRKWFIMLGSAASAMALSIVALATEVDSKFLVVVIFLLVALFLGVFRGINTIAYNDLMGRILRRPRRNSLIFVQTTIAGFVTILLTWAAHHLIDASTPLSRHLNLLWGGVGVTVLAALLIAIIREPLAPLGERGRHAAAPLDATDQQGYLATLREGLTEVAQVPWFRSYTLARGLLVSVELAMPFYSIHAAALHSHNHTSLSIFVVATSVAVIIGGPIWRMLGRISERYVQSLGAAVAACAGIWALVIDNTPALQHPIPHALVFALVALGTQGAVGARTVYLVNMAPEEKRPYYVAVSNTIAGVLGIILAFAFGSMAHLQGVVWPLFVIIGLNVLAVLASLRLSEAAKTS